MNVRAVMVHDGGEATILDGTGTSIANLNEALNAGATVGLSFCLPSSVLLILNSPRNAPDQPPAAETPSQPAGPNRRSVASDSSG